MPKKPKTYKGPLAAQIELPRPYTDDPKLPRITRQREEVARLEIARRHKLLPLLEHFGIARDDSERWYKLALALAIEHIPGFQAKRSPGRRKIETTWMLSSLYRTFIREMANQRRRRQSVEISDADVCRCLLRDENFRRDFPQMITTKRLQNLVAKARTLRRDYVSYLLDFHGRRLVADRILAGGGPVPSPPAWMPEESAFYKKYWKSGAPSAGTAPPVKVSRNKGRSK
jgi:hypothetical protein